jgi:hypothetical protein
MADKPTTVEQYLAALPADRREALQAVRKVILENLDQDYEEGIQYGMIGYYVPHRVYPAGYHCDPRQPLGFVALGSQKNYMSLHLMCVYGSSDLFKWFQDAWKKTGKKLDMGKACVRFKKLDDVALDVVGEVIRRVPAKKYIAVCEAALNSRVKKESGTAKKIPAKKAPAKSAARPRKKASSKKERKTEKER